MTDRMKYQWHHMSWKEVEMASQEDPQPVVLFPIGAIEQHGQQTPVGMDIVVAQYMSDRIAEATHCLSLPGLPFGYSPQFNDFHGTLTISPATITQLVGEVCRHVIHHGFDHIVIVNNHAGNAAAIETACRDIREKEGILIAQLFPYSLCKEFVDEVYPSKDGLFGHGAEPVVSLAAALMADDMRMDLAVKDNWSAKKLWQLLGGPDMKLLGSSVKLFFGLREVSSTGTLGDPTFADGEKGQAMLDRAVEYAIQFVEGFRQVTTRR